MNDFEIKEIERITDDLKAAYHDECFSNYAKNSAMLISMNEIMELRFGTDWKESEG